MLTSATRSLSRCLFRDVVWARPCLLSSGVGIPAKMSTRAADEVCVEDHKNVKVVTLNRPRALNSLNTHMVERMYGLYSAWNSTGGPSLVILKGAGGKAFCAGGDVRTVVDLCRSGKNHEAARFFASEYRLNFQIAQLRMPHVALLDGITMGGGAGVSVHGAFRVATEKTVFSMPELSIGLFPDVGASFFLPRLPGHAGMYLALTGRRLKGAEMKDMGLATHFVTSSSVPEIEHTLVALGKAGRDHTEVDKVLRSFEEPAQSGILDRLEEINATFGKPTLLDVIAELEAQSASAGPDSWARTSLEAIKKGSPWSAHVTFEQLSRGAHLPLSECLEMEYGLARRFTDSSSSFGVDFVEGVRAVLVDKDNSPKWMHNNIHKVPLHEVQKVFCPLPERERLGLKGDKLLDKYVKHKAAL